jgi:hypothetical protein
MMITGPLETSHGHGCAMGDQPERTGLNNTGGLRLSLLSSAADHHLQQDG